MKTKNTLEKVSLATLLTFVLSFSFVFAQNDTMYVMKDGFVINKQSIKAADVDSIKFFSLDTMSFVKNNQVVHKQSIQTSDVDSVIFYNPTIEEATSGTFTDTRDGNVYNWVQIGDQVWMAENLAYAPSGGNYWTYDDDNTNVETYGYLYDWQKASNVCPDGWHLPSDAEWTELTDFLGGIGVAGGKMKETGTSLWSSPNEEATNESDFSGLPGGARLSSGKFYGIDITAYFWSSTESGSSHAWYRRLAYDGTDVYRGTNYKDSGFSVRCVRD
jgi:uncharacterized protein (TIGR02145 family)